MELNDIRQGRNGDCFILSSIIAILHSFTSNYIKNIITNVEGTTIYSFSFWLNNKKYSIKLDSTNIGKSLSPKSQLWVKQIEYGYIYAFYQNNINNILEKGGMSHQVLQRLTGLDVKVYLNKLLDHYNEPQYTELCNIINQSSWDITSILNNTIIQWTNSIWSRLITKIELNDENHLVPNYIYHLVSPGVVGINGSYRNKQVLGIVSEHSYAIIGISIDDYDNKYLHTFNPQHKVESRITNYNPDTQQFNTIYSIDRNGKWAFNELFIFVSDFSL